jgi:hypothetical protein
VTTISVPYGTTLSVPGEKLSSASRQILVSVLFSEEVTLSKDILRKIEYWALDLQNMWRKLKAETLKSVTRSQRVK